MPEPLRAAIYARYSTELQNEKSVEDQLALAQAYAKREGYKVVSEYHDAAKSGASMFGRDGLMNLMDAAKRGQFDAIVVESLDRLSRDMQDLAGIHKELTFRGIKLLAVHEGVADTVTVGLRGLVGQLYREDNVHKIRRGMTGLLKQGLSAGGKAYGYRPDPLNKGKPQIVESEADIVRHIFQSYADGLSPTKICHGLNARHIPGPRGEHWQPSALLGMNARGTGILRNELYAGRIVWGKVRMMKDPSTGKRVSRPNPREDWERADVPDLRIISDDLFDAVQTQLASRSKQFSGENMGSQKRPQYLLSGLLKCDACGSGMVRCGPDKSGKVRLRCSLHHTTKSCPNPKRFYAEDVDELVIASLARELNSPTKIHAYAKTFMEQRHAQAIEENRRRVEIESRQKAIAKELEKITGMMIKGLGDEQALDTVSKKLGRERDDLQIELRSLPEGSNVVVHPAAIDAYAHKLAQNRYKLEMALHLLEDMGELHRLVREVIASITLSKNENGRIIILVENYLEPFLSDQVAPQKAQGLPGVIPLVAEEGLEPPTRGL